jgi:diguanylate cyclase (GGDEF)-like protein
MLFLALIRSGNAALHKPRKCRVGAAVAVARGLDACAPMHSSTTELKAGLGTARWVYPLLSAAVCLLALLAPVALGKTAHPSVFVVMAGLVSALFGYFIGSREDGIRALSAIDPLTGLFNRRHFQASFGRELLRAHRLGQPVGLLVIDIDGLKAINAALGREQGDKALCAVADALRHACRAADLCARTGGDEFVVLAPGSDETAARTLAERISATVHLRFAARRPIALAVGVEKPPQLSVSIGVAAASHDEPRLMCADALVSAADRALFYAKHQAPGRIQGASGEGRTVIRAARPALRLITRNAGGG